MNMSDLELEHANQLLAKDIEIAILKIEINKLKVQLNKNAKNKHLLLNEHLLIDLQELKDKNA